jgi:hypothetical protein
VLCGASLSEAPEASGFCPLSSVKHCRVVATSQALAFRATVMEACAEGINNKGVAVALVVRRPIRPTGTAVSEGSPDKAMVFGGREPSDVVSTGATRC